MADELPWPALDNVYRGATRGNLGSKGALGPPDALGCAVLQLRVQPGVFAVRLNRQCTEQYAILLGDVQGALRLSKTYWPRARRRQSYDARADQDHMELLEWLQQLKNRCMTHTRLLVNRGDIKGPPYHMSDDVEFLFLRMYLERRAAGVPHNPRLRDTLSEGQDLRRAALGTLDGRSDSEWYRERESTEPSDAGPSCWSQQTGCHVHSGPTRNSPTSTKATSDVSSLPYDYNIITMQIKSTSQVLRQAQARASNVQMSASDDLACFSLSFDFARREEQEVQRIQEQMDELINHMVMLTGSPQSPACLLVSAPPPPSAPAVPSTGPAGYLRLQQYPLGREAGHGEHEYRPAVIRGFHVPDAAQGSETTSFYPYEGGSHDALYNLRDNPLHAAALGAMTTHLNMASTILSSQRHVLYTEDVGEASWAPGYLERPLTSGTGDIGERAWGGDAAEE